MNLKKDEQIDNLNIKSKSSNLTNNCINNKNDDHEDDF